jgi:hypothetical protein
MFNCKLLYVHKASNPHRVKVKVALTDPKAQSGSRGTALLFLDLGVEV